MEVLFFITLAFSIGAYLGHEYSKAKIKKCYGDALDEMFVYCAYGLSDYITKKYGGDHSENKLVVGTVMIQAAKKLNTGMDKESLVSAITRETIR